MTEKKEAPKGILGKIKEKILPDEDEQAAIISTFVRLGVLVWRQIQLRRQRQVVR